LRNWYTIWAQIFISLETFFRINLMSWDFISTFLRIFRNQNSKNNELFWRIQFNYLEFRYLFIWNAKTLKIEEVLKLRSKKHDLQRSPNLSISWILQVFLSITSSSFNRFFWFSHFQNIIFQFTHFFSIMNMIKIRYDVFWVFLVKLRTIMNK